MQISSEPLISVRDLRKWFPLRRGLSDFLAGKPPRRVRAVDGITFDINRGEIFVIVGESGCGKTTTARLLLRGLDADGGIILFGGQNVATLKGGALKAYRRLTQVIFQDPYSSLNPRLRALDSLIEPLIIHGIGAGPVERRERAAKALEEVRLVPPEEFLDRYPHMLSGGQRQRLAIARALIQSPRFIVADEPVSMLDLSIRAEVLELLSTLRDRHGITYLYITHDLSTARYIADTIAIMYLGKIVEMGPADEVLSNPLHPYTQALRDAVPEPDPANRLKERIVKIKGEAPSAVDIPPGCSLHPRCPYAMTVCTAETPELLEVASRHFVACHLHPQGKPQDEIVRKASPSS